jgi:hypothetical protein
MARQMLQQIMMLAVLVIQIGKKTRASNNSSSSDGAAQETAVQAASRQQQQVPSAHWSTATATAGVQLGLQCLAARMMQLMQALLATLQEQLLQALLVRMTLSCSSSLQSVRGAASVQVGCLQAISGVSSRASVALEVGV